MLGNGHSDNGTPPSPSGMGGTAARDDARDAGGGIVPVGPDMSSGNGAAAWKGYLGCALGGVAAGMLPIVACAAISYGAFLAVRGRGAKELVLSAAFSVAPALAVSLVLGYASPLDALVACVASVAVAGCAARRSMSTTVGIITVAALSLALICCDAVVAWMSNTTIPEIAAAIVASYQASLGDLSVDTMAQVNAVLLAFKNLWPMSYVVMGLGEFCVAWVGVQAAARGLRLPQDFLPHLAGFDAPLWTVALFVASLLGLSLGSVVSSSTGLVSQVSLNVVMISRLVFVAQGLAVLSWLFRQRKMGPFVVAFLTLLAIYLELQFYVMTIAGLVDVWRNFRHLPRGKKVTVQDASNQK